MSSDEREIEVLRSTLEAAAGQSEVDSKAAFARVVQRGRVRRRARRTAAGGALALVLGVGVAGAAALSGGDAGSDLQVGTDGDPATTMVDADDPPAQGVTGVEDVDVELFLGQLRVTSHAAGEVCSDSGSPVVLPTIGATERYLVDSVPSTEFLDVTWAQTPHATVHDWLADPSGDVGAPVLIIAPTPFRPMEQAEGALDDDDPFGSLKELPTDGWSWVRCEPGGVLTAVPYAIEPASRFVTEVVEPAEQVGVEDIPPLPLFDDLRATSQQDLQPPSADLIRGPFDLDSHAWTMVAEGWCTSVGVNRPAGIEFVRPPSEDPRGDHTINGRPGIQVPWDHPLGDLPRVQLISASWDPDARPWPDTMGVARGTYEVYCGGSSAPLHYLAVKVQANGAWNIRWGSEPPELLADGLLPEDVIPEPVWRD